MAVGVEPGVYCPFCLSRLLRAKRSATALTFWCDVCVAGIDSANVVHTVPTPPPSTGPPPGISIPP